MGLLKRIQEGNAEANKAPLLIQAFMVFVSMGVNTVMIPVTLYSFVTRKRDLRHKRRDAEDIVNRINKGFDEYGKEII